MKNEKETGKYQSLYDGSLSHLTLLWFSNYWPITLTVTPIAKIKIKKINEKAKPFMESTTSLFLDCTFFSNSFTFTPPISPLV